MKTDQGSMTMVFYYDVAPVTVSSFLHLSRTGYYNGLTFHRILPNFVLQGGDPKGDGTGGPGYQVQAEFNDRPHLPGVLSMARSEDPNSAGSQFFVCLDYTHTQHLDHKYTGFGKVVAGTDTMNKLAATPLADPNAGRPVKPPVIESVEVKPVTATENPYADMFHIKAAK
jgi:peptidyl-prolyl cis-trans isomerase B (cyclophilin B)